MEQTTIFDMMYPKCKITKPIRLIEFFAGYGSQALALKYLGVPFEHWKICEWAVKSIQAYKDIHFTDEKVDLDLLMDKKQMVDFLYNKGISSNYNEPTPKQQIERLNESQLKNIIKNIFITHNLVNIQQVKGKDLEIEDTDEYEYILTYSFPCQDLSLAGKGKGMSDTSTRSGMLWEVERILTECKELGTLPQILLMENVPQVHGSDNVKDFNKWQLRLEELGYKNYWQDLIATDYGIPQTRNRCFMVSILGDYSYTFPKPIPLKLKLKDILEDNVDEKYYLSDKTIKFFYENEQKQKENGNGFRFNVSDGNAIAKTITTRAGSRMDDNFIGNKSLKETLEQNEIDDTCYIDTYNKTIDKEKAKTITTCVSFRNNTFLAIKNATKKGYLEATDGDGIDISSRMEHHRGTVQKDKAQTITTSGGNDRDVVVDTLKKDLCNKLVQEGLVEEGDVVKHSYTSQILGGNKKCVEKNDGNMITLTTRGDCVGVCVSENNKAINPLKNKSGKSWQFEQQVYDENGSARTLKASEGSVNIPKVVNDLRIRKLTPRECFRLMGVKDEDFERCAKNQSDASLYHLAGDSIVVNVLMAIFNELLGDDRK